jgi:hypothetical protein
MIGLYPVESSLQFLEAILLVYLFYYQASKEQRAQRIDQSRLKAQLGLSNEYLFA